MAHILVIHGPNLNLLGTREPSIYGTDDLDGINRSLIHTAEHHGHTLDTFQSNAEHAIVEKIHASSGNASYIIINPAAYTHSSIAIRDALLAINTPFIEVHLSNTHTREDFRKTSYFSDVALGVISGLGPDSYQLALNAIIARLKHEQNNQFSGE